MKKLDSDKIKITRMNIMLSDDFHEEEWNLLNRLWNFPTVKSLEGWLYNFYKFKSIDWSIAPNTGNFNPRTFSNNFDTSTYTMKDSEIEDMNNGGFEREMKSLFDSFHADLRRFHLHFYTKYDFDMLGTYTKAIYFLQENHDFSLYSDFDIIADSLEINRFLTVFNNYRKELIVELEWRMSRLNPFGHFNFHIKDEELTMYYNSIFRRGYRLNNPEKFKDNFGEILHHLLVSLVDVNTFSNDIVKLFGGSKAVFSSPIKWVAKKNALRYFVQQLAEHDKISDTNIYVIATSLFVDQEGIKFTDLKGQRSIPSNAKHIDKLIKLF